jgi:predicted Zn finger-like uncharacterized protein
MQQKMTIASSQHSMVTRCPKCSTAFRITEAQLESAKGAVRCGSCLHVFKAQSSLVTKPGADAAKKDAPVTKEVPAKKEPSLIEPFVNKDVTKSKSGLTKQTQATPTVSAIKENTKIEPTKPAKTMDVKTPPQKAPTNPGLVNPTTKPVVPNPQDKKVNTRTEPVISSTKTAAPKPAPKITEQKPATKSNNLKKPLSKLSDDDDMLISDDMEGGGSRYEFDGFMDIETQVQATSLFDRKVVSEKKVIKDNSDESWAENLIDDDEDVPQIGIVKTQIAKAPPAQQDTKNNLVFNFAAEEKKSPAKPVRPSNDLKLSDELSRMPTAKPLADSAAEEKEEIINAIPVAGIFHDEDFEEAANKRQLKIEPKIRSYDGSRAGLLKNIIPAPLEFAGNNIRHWYFRMLWPVMTFLALIAIVAQLAYFRFDHYARVQPYRNLYAVVCPMIGCKLPTLVDKKQIVTYNLVVQAHDQVEQALLVDVMLLNKAEFEQPFPDLLLSFSDMDDQVKASRRFTPKDYLGGELVGKKIMPSKQPIHITLEIKDPQVDNYKMDVL